MADKSEDIQSIDDKIALAKELYGTGSRSYLVKSYSDAVEDLSKACEMLEAVHGPLADELGLPYLMYAKSLIAVAQLGENKIVDVPDEDEEPKDDDGEGNNDDDEEGEEEEEEPQETDKQNGTDNGTEGKTITNGNGTTSSSSTSEPQPGTSSLATVDENQEDDDADSDSPAANLQLAWEVLELAVKIFTRQGEPALSNLADAYFELAEISFENSHFETAVTDYKNSEGIRMKLPDDDLRMLSLIQYKIGLSYYMNQSFDESIEAFKKACDILDCRIETAKSKEDKSEKDISNITELEEMKDEILAKIAEIEEMKQQSTEDVKMLLAKFLNGDTAALSSSGASTSASAGESSKPKPTDISHLIKRKKPDTPDDEPSSSSLAKKPSL